MNLLVSWFRSWEWRRFIHCCGFCILFISLIIYPSIRVNALQASPTPPSQTVTTNIQAEKPTNTQGPEVEGQVGANAGLVCGAVILVIIIIAGLIRSARWMPYRGHSGESKED